MAACGDFFVILVLHSTRKVFNTTFSVLRERVGDPKNGFPQFRHGFLGSLGSRHGHQNQWGRCSRGAFQLNLRKS